MAALPVTVVEDSAARVAFYVAAGTPYRGMSAVPMPEWIADGQRTIDAEWHTNNVLHLAPTGRAHSVQLFWKVSSARFRGWYVNLQDPLRPTPSGWDTHDHELDVLVWPDLSQWAWKDEEEFERRVEHGLLAREQADEVRREGERVIADIEARRPPFNEPWPDWRPDPTWPIPMLPPDWSTV